MSKKKMRAAMLYGIRGLEVRNIDVPEVGPGEVLVRVRAATTCGTDVKIFLRGYVERVIQLPTVFGHEWAGEVVEVGKGVPWIQEGMRVRAGNSAPCLRCKMCLKERYNLCEDMMWLWGAYAEYIRVPARMVILNMQEIPPHIAYEEAAVTEPLACVLHGIEEAHVKLGDTIAIIGAGPVGLLHLQLAKRIGVERAIVSDVIDERLQVAEKLGADEIVNSRNEDAAEAVKLLTDGYGADVVVEAVGLPTTWEKALKMVRKGGTVLEFGGCPPGAEIKVDTELLHYGEVTLLGSFHATPSHFKRALSLIASGAIKVSPLITRKMRLDDIKKAFERLTTSRSDLKIAIIP